MNSELLELLEKEIPPVKNHKGISFYSSLLKARFFNSSYDAIYLLRIYLFYSKKNNLLAKVKGIQSKRILQRRYNIFIGSNCSIGKGLSLPHPTSIVIGEDAVIGNDVWIYQNVTIGAKKHVGGTKHNEYPVIMDECKLYAGCVVLGNIILQKGTSVGANTVLLCNTEANSTYAGIPGRKIG